MKLISVALTCLVLFLAGCTRKLEEQNAELAKELADTRSAAATAAQTAASRIRELERKLADQTQNADSLRALIEAARPSPSYELAGEVFITN